MALQNEMNNLFPDKDSITKTVSYTTNEEGNNATDILRLTALDIPLGAESEIHTERLQEEFTQYLASGGLAGEAGQDGRTAEGNVDAGVNTAAGAMAGAHVAIAAASNIGLAAGMGKIGMGLISGKTPTPNVAPLSVQFAAIQNFFETEAEANAVLGGMQAAVSAGRGPTGPTAFGVPVTSSNPRGKQAAIEDQEAQDALDAAIDAMNNEDPAVDVTGHEDTTPGMAPTDAQISTAISEAQTQSTVEGLVDATEGPTATTSPGEQAAVDNTSTTSDVGGLGSIGVSSTTGGHTSPGEVSGDSDSGGSSSGDDGGDSGEADGIGIAKGGQIKGYQEGDLVEGQADTTMDTAGLGPMGLVDDMEGEQVTGVADDLEMQLTEGSYVLNAHTVELVGVRDLNEMVKDAISIAVESDIPLPKEVNATDKVPIKISNGEFVIPAVLVPIIGVENLEKMNKRGLEYRDSQKIKEEAPVKDAPETTESLADQILPTV